MSMGSQWLGRLTALALVLCSFRSLPVSSASTPGTLRYHYITGQHFSEVVRDMQTERAIFVSPKAGRDFTVEQTDSVMATYTVMKVYPDGSALLRITYANLLITRNGVSRQISTEGYADLARISPEGTLMDHHSSGTIPFPVQGDYRTPTAFQFFGQWPKYPSPAVAATAGARWSVQVGKSRNWSVWHFRLPTLSSDPISPVASIQGTGLETYAPYTDSVTGYTDALHISYRIKGYYLFATGATISAQNTTTRHIKYLDRKTGATMGTDVTVISTYTTAPLGAA